MDDKRAAILSAALDLISDRGFHDAPMSKIASTAGVSAGIIYHYFENKEDLINVLYRQIKFGLSQAVLDDYSDDLPFQDGFRRIWLNTASYCLQHPKEVAFLEQYENSPYLKPSHDELVSQYFAPLARAVQYGVDQGIIKDLPMEILGALTMGIAVSLAKKQISGKIDIDDEIMEAVADACWDAIRQ